MATSKIDLNGKANTWEREINTYGNATQLVHAGVAPEPSTGAILTPIYQNTTFVQESIDKYMTKGFSYSRSSNPTVEVLARKVAEIENGFGATCFSTGMAATTTVMSALLAAGDHCILTDCSYGGTNRITRKQFKKYNISFSYVDFRDVKNIEAAIQPNTKLVFSESPCNPTVTICDIAAISALCRSKGIVHCCDATFGTPLMCKPLDLGADLVLHSMTKFYDGHNMTVGGCVAAKTKEHHEMMKFHQNMHGNIMAPHTAFYILQTMKTMELRVTRQSENAMAVATFLESHPKVEKVSYPGLASYAQKELADRQHNLHGGMLWFEVYGGSEAGRKLMDSTQRPWSLCENLGAVESIITCPSVMTHANMLKEDRLKVGITDGFVRISCGIEDSKDLIAALKKSLDAL